MKLEDLRKLSPEIRREILQRRASPKHINFMKKYLKELKKHNFEVK